MGGIVYGMPFNGSVIKPFALFYMTTKKDREVPIPTECPDDTHPLKVFEETQVETNICRWVVFVLWSPASLTMVSNHYKPCGITVGRYGT